MRMIIVTGVFAIALIVLGVFAYHSLEMRQAPDDLVWSVPGGNAREGRAKMVDYGCHACHVIPGIREAKGRVGPKLEGFVEQIYIGGVLPNSPANLVRWIQDPKLHSPETAMPDLDVNEQDARDIAAYIYDNP